jgi:hypothetical protein
LAEKCLRFFHITLLLDIGREPQNFRFKKHHKRAKLATDLDGVDQDSERSHPLEHAIPKLNSLSDLGLLLDLNESQCSPRATARMKLSDVKRVGERYSCRPRFNSRPPFCASCW